VPAEPHRPAVVVLDVNETLTDMSPIRGRLVEVGASGALFDTWFAATLRDGFAVAAAGGYAEFADTARHVLTGLLTDRPNRPADVPAAVEHVLVGLPELDLHPDVPDGLRRLHAAGVRLVTLTNGASAMSDGAFARAGLSDLLASRLSVADLGRWKPTGESYGYAARQTGQPADRLALVAVHPWDIDGAARAGLTTGWLNRGGAAYPPYMMTPSVQAETLPDLADRLLALDGAEG
jgi:2-haloacid dehalogenase